MSAHHRAFEKEFQTEIKVNGKKLPLNHFIQETVGNMIVGLLKTLKEVDELISIFVKSVETAQRNIKNEFTVKDKSKILNR